MTDSDADAAPQVPSNPHGPSRLHHLEPRLVRATYMRPLAVLRFAHLGAALRSSRFHRSPRTASLAGIVTWPIPRARPHHVASEKCASSTLRGWPGTQPIRPCAASMLSTNAMSPPSICTATEWFQ